MKPDIKVLLKEAQRPHERFVPARAGWNGPEEKSASVTPNLTYEAMLAEPTPAEMRQQFFALALPDWRVLAGIVILIATMRVSKQTKQRRPMAPVIAFPKPAAALEDAA
jgi:hypothetical protein